MELYILRRTHALPKWAIKLIDPLQLITEPGHQSLAIPFTARELKARYQRLFKFPPKDEAKAFDWAGTPSVKDPTPKPELTFDQLSAAMQS